MILKNISNNTLVWVSSLVIFGNVRHNLSDSVTFAEVVNVTNHIGLWDAKFAWSSESATHWICLCGLRIHSFRPIHHCLITKVLLTQEKFLELSSYSTVINCGFTFHQANVGAFHSIMAQFKLIKHKFPN